MWNRVWRKTVLEIINNLSLLNDNSDKHHKTSACYELHVALNFEFLSIVCLRLVVESLNHACSYKLPTMASESLSDDCQFQ